MEARHSARECRRLISVPREQHQQRLVLAVAVAAAIACWMRLAADRHWQNTSSAGGLGEDATCSMSLCNEPSRCALCLRF